jgi:hypothetical protein
VSKVKSPEQKKQLSLDRDRRNSHRENSKSSRKNIARGKQRTHMDKRRSVTQLLGGLKGKVQEDIASEVELQVKVSIADSKNRGFKKKSDEPLGIHLARKKRLNNGATRA